MASFLTIDRPESRDLDDAIALVPTAKGYELAVAIANPWPAIAADRYDFYQVIAQGETLYRANYVKHMLPGKVLNQASLLPDRPRQAVVFRFALDLTGQVEHMAIAAEEIQCDRLSYDDVTQILGNPGHARYLPLVLLQAVTQKLANTRQARGAFGAMQRDGQWLDEDGRPAVCPSAAQQMVAECAILVNTRLAQWACDRTLPFIYRNHPEQARNPERDAEAAALRDRGDYAAARRHVACDLMPAEYTAQAAGHFALAVSAYAHCTSPLRRAADLFNMAVVLDTLGDRPLPFAADKITAIATAIQTTIAEHRDAKREACKQRSLNEMERKLQRSTVKLTTEEFSQLLDFLDDRPREDWQAIAADAQRRAAADQLSIGDLAALLNSPDPSLQACAAATLAQNPAAAVSALDIWHIKFGRSVEYDLWGPEAGHFLGRCWVDGQTPPTPAPASRKRDAKQAAAVHWLQTWPQGGLVTELDPAAQNSQLATQPSPPTTHAIVPPTDQSTLGPEAISWLNEYAQQTEQPMPSYTYGAIATGFQCHAQFNHWSAEGTGSNKREAKRCAAMNLQSLIFDEEYGWPDED